MVPTSAIGVYQELVGSRRKSIIVIFNRQVAVAIVV